MVRIESSRLALCVTLEPPEPDCNDDGIRMMAMMMESLKPRCSNDEAGYELRAERMRTENHNQNPKVWRSRRRRRKSESGLRNIYKYILQSLFETMYSAMVHLLSLTTNPLCRRPESAGFVPNAPVRSGVSGGNGFNLKNST